MSTLIRIPATTAKGKAHEAAWDALMANTDPEFVRFRQRASIHNLQTIVRAAVDAAFAPLGEAFAVVSANAPKHLQGVFLTRDEERANECARQTGSLIFRPVDLDAIADRALIHIPPAKDEARG